MSASPPGQRPAPRPILLLLAFGAGFSVMVIEIAGARLMAPVYGLSAVPWTAVIGVILTALALGNWLGGILADEGRVPLGGLLAVAGATALLPLLGSGLPGLTESFLGYLPGVTVASGLLLAPPALALGTVLPYLIRAEARSLEEVGRSAGVVSAVATVGSIVGTFATGFVLLPLFPLPRLLGLTAGFILLLAALAAWALDRRSGSGAALGLAALLAGGIGFTVAGREAGPGVLHAEETVHASIQVVETEWADGRRVRELIQSGGSSSAEEAGSGRPAHDYARVTLELLEDRLGPGDSVLVLGGGALTLPVALVRRHPGLRVTVVELDPAATRLAERYFAYDPRRDEGVTVIHRAARPYLAHDRGRYDVVVLDVYDHFLTVPWTVVTREALESIRARLAPEGVLVVNLLTPVDGPGAAFLERLLATLDRVFPRVRALPTEGPPSEQAPVGTLTNVLLVAGSGAAGSLPGEDRPGLHVVPEGPVLTDAWAPMEALQARVLTRELRWR